MQPSKSPPRFPPKGQEVSIPDPHISRLHEGSSRLLPGPAASLSCLGLGSKFSFPPSIPFPSGHLSTHRSLVRDPVRHVCNRSLAVPAIGIKHITFSRESWATLKAKQNKPIVQHPPSVACRLPFGFPLTFVHGRNVGTLEFSLCPRDMGFCYCLGNLRLRVGTVQ